jgi:hypothetical protein
MLLERRLSHNLLILLLSLYRLNPHHLQLDDLHLNLGLRRHIGGKTWAERNAIRVYPTSGLVLREMIGTINSSCHRYMPILRDVLVEDFIYLVLLRKRGGVIIGRKMA